MATVTRRYTRCAHRLLLGAILAALCSATLPGFPLAPDRSGVAHAAPTTYYVDCLTGNDGQPGHTEQTAWRTLSRANSARLVAGNSLLLRRGCVWTGPLQATWTGTASQPIVIGAYGTGAQPVIQNADGNVTISGSYLVIQDLHVRADAPARDPGCNNQGVGQRDGFRFLAGAAYNTLRRSTASELTAGVHLLGGAHHNRVLENTLRDNTLMFQLDRQNSSNDAGAFGILVEGDDNEIAYNQISGSAACSYDYGRDGSAVEIYGGQRNYIHHNQSADNVSFTELGHARTADNFFAYNIATSSVPDSTFVVTRGAADTFGPVARTVMVNNTAYFTHAGGFAATILCLGGCTRSTLVLKNNIVWSEGAAIYYDGEMDEGHNIYWKRGGSPTLWSTVNATSRVADPQFADSAVQNFHLRPTSPAIKSATTVSPDLWRPTDYSSSSDIGAFAFAAGAVPPTATPVPALTSVVSSTATVVATATATPTRVPTSASTATPATAATSTPPRTPTVAATPTPTPPVLGSATPTTALAGCRPRPNVSVAVAASGTGRLQVTVSAPTLPGAANSLQQLQFGAATNALIDAGGQTGMAGNFTVSLPAGSQQATFSVRRATSGQATTVPLIVTDNCGPWDTLVGGGPTTF